MERTIINMFETSVSKYGSNVFLKESKNGKYEALTYDEAKKYVYYFAAGLISLGINKGDRLALISEGRNFWVISELGILYAGAVNVPISVKIDELNDLKFRLDHSGTRIAVVSASQLHKIRGIKNDLPELEKTIVLDKIDDLQEDELCVEDLLKTGEEFLKAKGNILIERMQSVKENDYANICYTSGTTADPKGIVLSHRNYTANVEQATSLLPIPEWYTTLLILPWDHAFAHTAGIYTLMYNGASMAAVETGRTPLETLKNIPKNIKEIKPTFLLSVPALAKNFRKNIEKGIREKGKRIEQLFNSALKLAYNYNAEGWNRGNGKRKLLKPLYKLYDKILFSKIRENFGGRLEFFIGGGALLDIELQRFFYAIGIPMFQGYGLTEAAPIISANVPAKHKLGSSGRIVDNLEVKICDSNGSELPAGQKGEIVVRGENVMVGYWKNEKATAETIKDGWLYSGDLGYLDEDGFLYVLGRFKSLLIASDGEKYSPEGIEEALTENSKFIEQVMLYNNQSPYTIALIVPNKEQIKRFLDENNLSHKSEEGQNAVIKLIDEEISKFKQGGQFAGEFPERWLPAAFSLLGEAFTEQNHFLNSTLKMVRGKITEFYKQRIDYLYTPEGKNIYNHQNKKIVERMFQ
ncbi:long-chain-fatty-acid-CoA ligase [Melioribacter roseus P3M-2]|uniref:Long-chain-fatty-acid-CoA ligase n=1 Tax=Melioribacter roseus (strain DSM 23840 / JCM 17771 / VKM B-2668 / P3M-2) TaxID=1191523 RepID=I6YTJ1_MELRP|nr:AMP-binding protein [Melioribacter roseus]AFN73862.1 long-chain-fatty-acid-CoA ligase [Melioribacter roseus P3M-2]